MSRIIKADRLTYTTTKKRTFTEDKNNVPANSSSEVEDIYNETKKMVEELIENARIKAEQILYEAKIKAEVMIEESKEEIEKQLEEAWDKGYSEGRDKGEREYLELKESANKVIQEAFIEKEVLLKNSEQEVLNFITDTLDRICFGSLIDKNNLILEVSKYLIDFVKDSKGQVILKVSGADFEFLNTHKEELAALLTTGTLSVKMDKHLNQGHCMVVSEKGILEVDLEENLEKVKAVLQDVVSGD